MTECPLQYTQLSRAKPYIKENNKTSLKLFILLNAYLCKHHFNLNIIKQNNNSFFTKTLPMHSYTLLFKKTGLVAFLKL